MAYTAGDQINRALRLLGVLAEGETPSAETSADALMAFNQMLDSWSTERLSVFSTIEQVVTWPAGQATRTFGPSGDLVGVRPVSVDDSSYFKDAGDVRLSVNMTYPNIELTVSPVPDQNLELHLISVRELVEPATLSTALALPPGYLRALTYNLAMELAPEFGMEPSIQVQKTAASSKRDLKRINNPKDVMSMPSELLRDWSYDINKG